VNAKDDDGFTAINAAACNGDRAVSCVKLLVENGADVDDKDNLDGTPLVIMDSASGGYLDIAQYLLYQKADIHCRTTGGAEKNRDPLYYPTRMDGRTPRCAFAFLSCNTGAKNVNIDNQITAAIRDAHIETYQHVQAYIDEYHCILNLVLSEHVPVDPRFGLGQMGIYQEPLIRTLEYLGLSMAKNQVVNTSIDGEAVKRALIPGHLLNTNHWFDKYTSR
jgi:hypothetical protein